MEQKAKGQNYYVNTKGRQVLSIAIWTMNKTVGVSMLVQYELGFYRSQSSIILVIVHVYAFVYFFVN